jgi:hypothetical protein
LIAHIVPSDPDEDADTAEQRHNACLEHLASIIERYRASVLGSWMPSFC